jgi:hypothetical protein
MFCGALCGDLRRAAPITLYKVSRSERGGVNSFVTEELYRRILLVLIVHENGIFSE